MSTTPTYGNTTQGQQLQATQDLLNKINGTAKAPISSSDLQSGANAFQSAGINMQANAGPAIQSATQSLTNQAGIPALNSSYSNLDKIFQLYQADTSLSSKYSNGQNPNPYANSALAGTSPTTGAANPYLSSPDAIAASTTPTAPGFSTPGLSLQASAQPAQSATTLLDLINSLTSTEQGIVNQKSGDVSQNYQDALSVLGTLATQFGDAYTASKSGSGGVGGSQNAATQYQTLKETLAKSLGRDPTETEVWQYIQNNRSTWEAEGLDMATIDKLEQQDAQRFGTGKTIPVTTGIKQKTMTVTPKTSTVKGKTTTTGWTVKMSDGSSKLITRPGSNWMSSDKTASYDPQLIVSEYQSAGATDEEIIQKLQVLGFIVQ